MKKQYETAIIEINEIKVNDVIATSTPFNSEEQPLSKKTSFKKSE